MEKKERQVLTLMLIFVEMMQTTSVEAGRTTDDAMYFVTFIQQQFGPYRSINKRDRAAYTGDLQIRPILARDTCLHC